MADVMDATNQERAKRVAVERIVGFAKQFDEVHLNLACHAAFPLVLTPDLLYQIWAHFVPEVPWSGVARVLLSRLCRQVGYEMYEMDIAVRNLLLRELKEQFGQERLDELAEFLMDYVAQQLTENDADTQDLREAQEWTALAYTKPDEAARELALALSERVKQEDIGEVLRLTSLVETLAEPLREMGFEPLLIYAHGMRSFVRGDHESAKQQFSKLLMQGSSTEIAGINLDIPLSLSISPKIEPGTLLLNRYRVVRQLGRGGFSETFEVDDRGTPKFLKVLRLLFPSVREDAVSRFQREAFFLSQLDHPGIPKADSDGYFTWPENSRNPLPCLIMEYIEGQDLERWLINNQQISENLAIDWMLQITEILDYLHRNKLIHRDIKPSNIVLKDNGKLVLVDFSGILDIEEDDESVCGTEIYMPPEQKAGRTVMQSDFFAFGVTFIQLLTGKHLVDFYSWENVTFIWRDAAPQASSELKDLIDELTAPSPQERPRNSQVILNRLKAISDSSAHFSTLRTKLSHFETLIDSLLDLGISIKTNAEVRGRNGLRVNADLVAVLLGECDLGFSRNSDGSFDLIADLWGISKNHNQTELINSIFDKYTANQLKRCPDDSANRKIYLERIGSRGTPEQQQEAIAQTAIWLQAHPENLEVRQQYQILVNNYSKTKQKPKATTRRSTTDFFEVGQVLEAKVTNIKGNKVTYNILGTKLTKKETKIYKELSEDQTVKVKIMSLRGDGKIKTVKVIE